MAGPTDKSTNLIEAALTVASEKDEAALDERLKAVLTSETSTNYEVFAALQAGAVLNKKRTERTREIIAESRAIIAKVSNVLNGVTPSRQRS